MNVVRRWPEPVRRLRQRAQSVKGIDDWRFESILLYKKELTVKTDPALFRDTRYGLMDTTWFNLMPFLNFIVSCQGNLRFQSREELALAPPGRFFFV